MLSYICKSDSIASGYNYPENETLSIMVDTDTNQSVTSTKSEEDLIIVVSDAPENVSTKDEADKEEETKEEENKEDEAFAKRRAEAKKGISITRALITFGFENWIALEPGTHLNISIHFLFILFTISTSLLCSQNIPHSKHLVLNRFLFGYLQ